MAPLAVLAIPVVISVALWRGSAPRTQVAYEKDCNSRDPLASCYVQRQPGIEVDGLVFNDIELQSASISDHALAVVRFAPKASQDDIAKFLDSNKASVVDGPKSGGLYTVRLPANRRGQDRSDQANAGQLRDRRIHRERAIADLPQRGAVRTFV